MKFKLTNIGEIDGQPIYSYTSVSGDTARFHSHPTLDWTWVFIADGTTVSSAIKEKVLYAFLEAAMHAEGDEDKLYRSIQTLEV